MSQWSGSKNTSDLPLWRSEVWQEITEKESAEALDAAAADVSAA